MFCGGTPFLGGLPSCLRVHLRLRLRLRVRVCVRHTFLVCDTVSDLGARHRPAQTDEQIQPNYRERVRPQQCTVSCRVPQTKAAEVRVRNVET